MFVAGILVPDWYMQFVGGKKLWKPVSFLNPWTLLPFSWIGILEKDLHLQVVLFWGLAEFAVCLPTKPVGRALIHVGMLEELGLDPRAGGIRVPPQSIQRGLQPHLRTTVKHQLCKHPLHHLCSESDHGPCLLYHMRKWEYLAYTRCSPQGMSAVFHLLLGAAKATDGGERWMEIICSEANHSRHTEPSGAGALPHLRSFCILANMEFPGRAERSCCSCVLEWPPVVRSDLEWEWAESHPVMLTLMKRRRSRNRTG